DVEDRTGERDAALADLAGRAGPAPDLVRVQLPLAVEVLPGLVEIDAGHRLLRGLPHGIRNLADRDRLLGQARRQLITVATASETHQAERESQCRQEPACRRDVSFRPRAPSGAAAGLSSHRR